jgi:transcriptional regulator with XRE-family HTH domain
MAKLTQGHGVLDVNLELEAALARARKSQRVYAADVAEASGMAPSTFSAIRTGRRVPSWQTALRIAEVLDVAVADLFPELEPD